MASKEQIETLLESAGLRIEDADERATIAARFESVREGIEALYAIPDIRYEDFGLNFEAAPPLGDWRSEARDEQESGTGRSPRPLPVRPD